MRRGWSACALAGAAAALGACAGERSWGERRILADLEGAGVARPGPDGQWERSGVIGIGGAGMSGEGGDGGGAALAESGPITLADLLRVAEARNAGLAAARSEAGVAAGEAWQAWLYPNPRVEVESEEISFGDGTRGAEVTVGVAQPVVLSGRREAAVRAAEAEREARLAEAEAARRALFGDVAAEHARLTALREQHRLYDELREVVEGTLRVAQTRLEARAAPEMEVLRVRVELKRIESAAARVQRERETAERRLGALLGGAAVDADRLEEAGPDRAAAEGLDFAALERAVRGGHPALAAREREIAAAEARLERAREARTPDLELRVAVGYSDAADDGIVEVGAGVEAPLWDRRQGEILSRRFEVMRARQRLTAQADELAAELAEAVGQYESARQEVTAMREGIVPDAQRAFDLTRAAYEGGRASFLDVFDVQRTLVEARVGLAEATGRASVARARVARIAGVAEEGVATDETQMGHR